MFLYKEFKDKYFLWPKPPWLRPQPQPWPPAAAMAAVAPRSASNFRLAVQGTATPTHRSSLSGLERHAPGSSAQLPATPESPK